MPGTPGVGTGFGGVAFPFPTTIGTIGGIQIPIGAIAVGPDAAPYVPQASSGLFLPMPVGMAAYDPDMVPVFVGDAVNNSIRTSMVGAIVAQLQQLLPDGDPFVPGTTPGLPATFLRGYNTVSRTGAAARVSNDNVLQTTGPPRENIVQGFQVLDSTEERQILPSAAPGVYQDLTWIHISSSTEIASTVVFFRDSVGGTVRYPVAISKSGGSNIMFPKNFNQTSPELPWTVQLETAVTGGFIFVVTQAEKRTAS